MARARRRPLSLPTLLEQGRWGHLRLGVSRQVAVGVLGQPDAWQRTALDDQAEARGQKVAGWALSEVLRYGAVELHFPEDPRGGLRMIFSDDLDALAPGVDAGGLVEGMPLPQVQAWLDARGLAWRLQPFELAPGQLRLVLDSGARLGLVDDDAFFEAPGQGPRLFCVEVSGA